MKLYCFAPSPNTRKVFTVAHHLELDVDIEHLNLAAGDQRKPEYLKINPNGFAPSVTDGDFKLWELPAWKRAAPQPIN